MPFFKAVIGMKRMADGSPQNQPLYSYAPHQGLAFCYMELGMKREAIHHLHEVIRYGHDVKMHEALIAELKSA